MKTILVAALASLPFLASADAPSTAPNTQAPQPTEELKVMTDRLGLTKP